MAAIIWDIKKMSTGVAAIDAHHKEWIRRFNLFDEAISQGKGIEVVQNTLDFFIKYADIHFKFEESVMNERNCPAAKDNRDTHENMRNTLDGFKAYANKHGYSTSEIYELKHQMEEWLIKHILTIDIQLRDT